MKKTMMILACLMMLGMQSVKAQVAIAALHHNDSVEIYSAAKIQTAIDAAVAGDTIYLSEGMFGGFTVTKPIAIIGAGQTTSISSNITIGKNSETLKEGLILSGLNIIQDVTFYGYVSGVKISQCKIVGSCTMYGGNTGNSYDNIEIVMSQIKSLGLSYVKGLTVVASKISTVSGVGTTEGSVTFLNCNISSVSGGASNRIYDNYVNCIIGAIGYSIFQNCLYRGANYSGVLYNCYKNSDFTLDDDLNCSLTDEQLKEAGYLGTDNTVVGITGGDVQFSLVMPIVQITEHNLEVDNVERKLKVSLKLGNK